MATPRKPKHLHKKSGQPTVWTPDMEQKFWRVLDSGASLEDAAIICGAGIPVTRHRQRTDPKFSEEIIAKKVGFKATSLAIIAKAALTNWTAAAWWLERRHPEEYGRRRIELTGDGGGPISVTTDEIGAIAARTRANPEAVREFEDGLRRAVRTTGEPGGLRLLDGRDVVPGPAPGSSEPSPSEGRTGDS